MLKVPYAITVVLPQEPVNAGVETNELRLKILITSNG